MTLGLVVLAVLAAIVFGRGDKNARNQSVSDKPAPDRLVSCPDCTLGKRMDHLGRYSIVCSTCYGSGLVKVKGW